MAKLYTLRITEDQAEMLGYALTLAKRIRLSDASRAKIGSMSHDLAYEHAAKIEALRDMLDRCPETIS